MTAPKKKVKRIYDDELKQVSVRIEESLYNKFSSIVKLKGDYNSHVLAQLIRDYVKKNK